MCVIYACHISRYADIGFMVGYLYPDILNHVETLDSHSLFFRGF